LELITDFHGWFLIFCLIAGFVYAFFMYYRLKPDVLGKRLPVFLFLVRFFTVAVISFLLLGPLIKTITRNTQKPLLIFVQDNSASVSFHPDTSFLNSEYPEKVEQALIKLSGSFDVDVFSFGKDAVNELQFGFNENRTNISGVFDLVKSRYSQRNVGIMILASDGIYNGGINPVYALKGATFPVYTIALGDTLKKKDASFGKIIHNDVVFSGGTFPVEIYVNTIKCNGEQLRAEILRNDTVVASYEVLLDDEHSTLRIPMDVPAIGNGTQLFDVRLSGIDDEFNLANNKSSFFVNIIKSKQKILLLAFSPHPDISALNMAISKNKNLELKIAYHDDEIGDFSTYNLIILHQLPAKMTHSFGGTINNIINSEIPVLYVLGPASDLNLFNGLKTGLEIVSDNKTLEAAFPVLNTNFSFFTLGENHGPTIQHFAPLNTPFGTYRLFPGSQVLFYQKISGVPSDYPLFAFVNDQKNRKSGFICGTGIWRWRLNDFDKNGNHRLFTDIVGKSVQYLTIKSDNRLFRVKTKQLYEEGMDIEIVAELYNENFELVNIPEVEINIVNDKGNEYPFVFRKHNSMYFLNTGEFPAGKYSFTSSVTYGGQELHDRGEFVVASVDIEKMQTLADHASLFEISSLTGGEMFYPPAINDLSDHILNRNDIRPVVYFDSEYIPLINVFTVFVLIVALLSLEWFIRKWAGLY